MNKRFTLTFLIYVSIVLVVNAEAIYAETHSHEHSGIAVKCGTMDILARKGTALNGTATLSERTTGMDASAVSSLGHFRAHYDTSGYHSVDMFDADGNGVPDYVDSTLVYLEIAWHLQIEELGYPVPISDGSRGGGPEVDVYMRNMGNTYGQTHPESLQDNSATSYMEIENDFAENVFQSKGYDALKVTTAHEFFHVIQFSMYYNYSLVWWMEQTAVWMEDRTWDDVNDYIYYLFLFFNKSYNQTPLDSGNGDFKYGAVVWPHYLVKKYGDIIIRDIWNNLAQKTTADISSLNDVLPDGLAAAFGEFAVWNYFTAERGNPIDFYPDSDKFTVRIDTDSSVQKNPAADTLSTKKLTSRYVEMLFAGEWNELDTLHVSVNALDGGLFVNNLIFYNGPYDYAVHEILPGGTDIRVSKNWSKAVLVTSCVKTTTGTYSYNYDSRINNTIDEPIQYAFSIKGNYPNPFNGMTTISFTLPETGTVTIQAFDTLGRKAADIFTGTLDAGAKEILWKPADLSGGIYIVRMSSPWGTKTLKTMYLK